MAKWEVVPKGLAPIDPELDARLEAMEEAAERYIAEARVDFCWNRLQLDTVERAAALKRVSLKTYFTEAAYRQAVADLTAAKVPLNASTSD